MLLRPCWLIVSVLAWAGFAAGAAAGVVTVAWRFGFAAQGFELIPGLEVFAVKGGGETFITVEQYHDFVAHGQHINNLAFTLGRNDALVAFRQLLARLDILLVLVDETAAQASAHAGDF